MSEKESKRNKLLLLLKTKSMTSKELTDKLEIPIEFVWVYISQFKKDGKIIKVGKKGKFNLYSVVESNPIELLKQLYEFMSKMNLGDYIPNDKEIKLVEQIVEMVK